MRPKLALATLVGIGTLAGCAGTSGRTPPPRPDFRVAVTADPVAYWNSATVYFLLTDRFRNGDPSNDAALDRTSETAVLRGFEGGDLAGVRQKLEEGYFDALGVDAIWMTPFQEQIRGFTDEGTGVTYAYHGYWPRDWTAVDPALGSADDLRAVIEAAHARGIRVLMDAVINHTGPVTSRDPAFPADWVRTSPTCRYEDYESTVSCTLVENLPDVRTESDRPVELPRFLLAKWQSEGRLVQEVAELEEFFERTGYPRAPRYYLIKWLTDWVREYGFDGYRVDTAKHFEESVSAELRAEADRAFAEWKTAHPGGVPGDLPFYMVGEVYNYGMSSGREFRFDGGEVVDFFAHGYDALINFDFSNRTDEPLDALFARYSRALRAGDLSGVGFLNYVSSHDDSTPWDRGRDRPLEAGTRLLLAPGGAQIYYGDEVARPLEVEGAVGDAKLRSPMPWDEDEAGQAAAVREHWRKLGRFRQAHPAIGAGEHRTLQTEPLLFSRTLRVGGAADRVLVGLGWPAGAKSVPVHGLFPEGARLFDAYGGARGTVTAGSVSLDTPHGVILLAERSEAG